MGIGGKQTDHVVEAKTAFEDYDVVGGSDVCMVKQFQGSVAGTAPQRFADGIVDLFNVFIGSGKKQGVRLEGIV
ncbi:hypothetical protein H6A64_08730 [Lacrimispora saccharolytica]|nr:hypothetical protein [Lacrimispora saccharolytica]